MIYPSEFSNNIDYLEDIIDLKNPHRVISEVKLIISSEFPEFNFIYLYNTYYDVVRLYGGKYPDYRECNTHYHDLHHAINVFLATAQLIFGYNSCQKLLTNKYVNLCLISSFMHSTGFIQTVFDNTGSGAKYSQEYIIRSIMFQKKYFENKNYKEEDYIFCKNCILCTCLNVDIEKINFKSHEEKTLGQILGTAYWLSQIAERKYLEKLLFLYYELREGNALGYENELDLLKKTLKFYNIIAQKLFSNFCNLQKYMIYYFQRRWNIDKDLYLENIQKNIMYLRYIIDNHQTNYRDLLSRGGIVQLLIEKGL